MGQDLLLVMLSINQYQPLFLVSVLVISERCKDIVISALIMSFLVIITSLINRFIVIEKVLIFIDNQNQKVDIISVSVIGTYLK